MYQEVLPSKQDRSSCSRSKRLMRELAEVTHCPVPNISCSPVGDDLNEWHGNVRATPGSPYESLVIHFVVMFPKDYPLSPPRVMLSTFYPHINVIRQGGQWEVCLDMLEKKPNHQATLPYQYWSSAFSVRSLLLQLSSFILAEGQAEETSMGSMSRAVEEAKSFACKSYACNHSWKHTSPEFPSSRLIDESPLEYPSVSVNGTAARATLGRIFNRRKQVMNSSVKCDEISAVETKSSDSNVSGEHEEVLQGSSDEEHSQKEKVDDKDESSSWTVVSRGNSSLSTSVSSATCAYSTSTAKRLGGPPNLYSVLNESSIIEKLDCSQCLKKYKATSFTKTQLSKGVERKCDVCVSSLKNGNGSPQKVGDKNFLKRERKRLRKMQQQQQMGVVQKSNKEHEKPTVDESDRLTKEHEKPIIGESDRHDAVTRPDKSSDDWRGGHVGALTIKNMGYFAMLCTDTLLPIACYAGVNDLLSLGASCRGTSHLIHDWVLWKFMLRERFPRSSLKPSMSDAFSWRHAYQLEANGLAAPLRCFHTLATKDDGEILTMPVEYTVNPKSGEVDYATSTFDVLSWSAFSKQLVRRTVWGEKFSTVIPYYIDEDHFEKSLKILKRVSVDLIGPSAVKMSPESGRSHGKWKKVAVKGWAPSNEPEMMLTLIVRLMNTQVVLLCDKGVEVSDISLTGYCQLHRLLLAVLDSYPQLRALVNQRLRSFLMDKACRVKDKTPSLGELMVYLSVSDVFSWQQLAMAYLFESFDRAVLWSCSKDPSLAEVVPGDVDRLDRFLNTQKVGLRLILFHCIFLDLLVEHGGSPHKISHCKDRADLFQGRPPLSVRRRFHERVKSILRFETWPQFFCLAGVPLPHKQVLLQVLERSVGNSLQKGYHSLHTKFHHLMRSGVSKILLKGESYSAAPNIKRVQVTEKWRYDGDVIFLDASCLVFDFHGKQLGRAVDYSNRLWSKCVQHSGDVLAEGQGQHTIDIHIPLIPPTVKALYFTVSAWTTSLREVSQPSCHLHDLKSDTELCRYKLEGVDTGDKTAVIMCKLHRFSPTSRWELTSIGSVGYGRAGNYSPIIADIKRMDGYQTN